MRWQGLAASPGIGIGSACIKQDREIEIEDSKIKLDEVARELQDLQTAIERAEAELSGIQEELSGDEAEVIEVQLMFLQDPELIPAVKKAIKDENHAAVSAVKKVTEEYAQRMAALDNEYLQVRAADIRDMGKRLIKHLPGGQEKRLELPEEAIVVARDLHPSETAELDREKLTAFVTEKGSHNSHTAIIARALGIPAVVGVGTDLINKIENGELVIVDGSAGEVFVNPDQEKIEEYRIRQEEYRLTEARWSVYRDKPAKTGDGRRVEVFGNITGPEEAEQVMKQGGEGIGLFRTEFIFMNRQQPPPEEEQFAAYKKVVTGIQNKPVIIRTLDIGGDKDLPYFDLKPEANPFLGFRGIRFCLQRPQLFKTQLKAILRTAVYGQVKLMLPLICSVREVIEARKMLIEAGDELQRAGKEFKDDLELGVMMETPAAVRIADVLAEKVDFFSIGTNDLIQYTLAVDRTNQLVSDLYTPYHPAVLGFIGDIIESGHRQGIPVAMCGEAAGDRYLLPFLLGAGLDEFSLNAGSILRQKGLISTWTIEEAEEVYARVLTFTGAEDVKEFLQEIYRE